MVVEAENNISSELLNNSATSSTSTVSVTEEDRKTSEEMVTWIDALIEGTGTSSSSSNSSSTNSELQHQLIIDSEGFLIPAIPPPPSLSLENSVHLQSDKSQVKAKNLNAPSPSAD